MKEKVFVVVGTRPEAIKLIPVFIELKKRINCTYLVSSGQHKEMLSQVFKFFEIDPDFELGLMKPSQTLSDLCAKALTAFDRFYQEYRPSKIIVQGDTSTAFVAALAAYYNRIQVAHVEAGLRTNNKYEPFPEEINRKMISQIADMHFAPTKAAYDNLVRENTENVEIVGNTVVDALFLAKSIVVRSDKFYKKRFKEVINSNGKNILITGHRRESFGKGFQEITKAILALSKKYPQYSFVYPVHLNPKVKDIVFEKLSGITNIHLLDPVDYGSIVYLMMNSKLVLTDSGGIQEEAPSLNKPIIVMRNTTERPEGIKAGCAVLSGTSTSSIIETFENIINNRNVYQKMSGMDNPFGDGDASKRIAKIIKSL